VFGRVKLFHAREDILQPSDVIDQAKLQSVSRLGGISYGRYVLSLVGKVTMCFVRLTQPLSSRAISTTKGLELPRPVWAKESQREPAEIV
jgi:hypothetical protein